MIHTKEEINSFLSRAFFAVLSYSKEGRIYSQLMIFGHTIDGVFYLASENDKKLFAPLEQELDIGMLIYKEEEDLSNIRQVYVQGKGSIIDGVDSEDFKMASIALGEKSPRIQNILEERHDSLTVIKVGSDLLSSISFGELKKHLSPITLKRV